MDLIRTKLDSAHSSLNLLQVAELDQLLLAAPTGIWTAKFLFQVLNVRADIAVALAKQKQEQEFLPPAGFIRIATQRLYDFQQRLPHSERREFARLLEQLSPKHTSPSLKNQLKRLRLDVEHLLVAAAPPPPQAAALSLDGYDSSSNDRSAEIQRIFNFLNDLQLLASSEEILALLPVIEKAAVDLLPYFSFDELLLLISSLHKYQGLGFQFNLLSKLWLTHVQASIKDDPAAVQAIHEAFLTQRAECSSSLAHS